MATMATYTVPKVENENNVRRQPHLQAYSMLICRVQKHYSKGSPDRRALEEVLAAWETQLEVSAIIDGKEVR